VSAEPFSELHPNEHQLAAHAVGDAVDRRIFWLVTQRLVALGNASGGWDSLFRDPHDGRLWELTFPHGSVHGGGPRQLAAITPEAAAAKYR
jgi:hypothetical protein